MMTEARAVLVSADSEVPHEDFFLKKKLSEVPKGQESYIPALRQAFPVHFLLHPSLPFVDRSLGPGSD